MANRMSMYSLASEGFGGPRGGGQQQPTQVSTTTLLKAVHNIYLSSQAYRIDAGSSLVVNTWLTATQPASDGKTGGTVDEALAARAWEHARRRAEDGCIILGSLHQSTPSVLRTFLSSLPLSIPEVLSTALGAIEPFLNCVTPDNPSMSRHMALGVTLSLNLAGHLTGVSIALSQGGVDTEKGLLKIPAEPGYRAFDVFYYLLLSASTPAEREFLGLKSADHYTLLKRSGTYELPSYLATADDGAAADDFRSALRGIGIKGSAHRNLISLLAGLLALGDTLDYQVDKEVLEESCAHISGLLGVEPDVLAHKCTTEDRAVVVSGLYEAVVDWVITKANLAIAAQMGRGRGGDDVDDGCTDDGGDSVCITVLDVPDPKLCRAMCMRGIFDDTQGIHNEMKQDGLEVASAGSLALRDVQEAVAERGPDLGIMVGTEARERQHQVEKREEVLERVLLSSEEDGFLHELLPLSGTRPGTRLDLAALLASSRAWYHLSMHPTDDSPERLATMPSVTSAWSAATVSRQMRAWRLSEWANRRNKHLDFTADFDHDEFVQRYRVLGCMDGRDGIESWVMQRGWSNGEVVVGRERVWMREAAWWEAESMLDLKQTGMDANHSGFFHPQPVDQDPFLGHYQNHHASQAALSVAGALVAPSLAPTAVSAMHHQPSTGDYGLGQKGDSRRDQVFLDGDGAFVGLDAELADGKKVESRATTPSRRAWVAFVWAMTFLVPSPALRYIGRMKRPDVRMAWREKVVICFLIALINALIVFWIIFFGRILCPNFDKAWSRSEVATHQGDNDFWVSIHGKVYDISRFWKLQHGGTVSTSQDLMRPFAGLDLDEYFPAPLTLSCRGVVTDSNLYLTPSVNNTPEFPNGMHVSGARQPDPTTNLHDADWYTRYFQPRIKEYYHGDLVWDANLVLNDGANDNHMWFIYNGAVYDLTDYYYTKQIMNNLASYSFLDSTITELLNNNPGQDLSGPINQAIAQAKATNQTEYVSLSNKLECIKNTFYIGIPDFRFSARCQTNNWVLLGFTVIIASVILIKFVSALQFGSKRRPPPQDKFVVCQVPAYTEGEDSLRKALDSLTALQYDNKRKLICVICDGVMVGAGNDRPTPKIVLDVLGVDPKLNPPALPFHSVGAGGLQLNYGKVYSGLYESEGNVVPYVVVVKVGKPSEQNKTKPGNRGKRDSQILLMSFLNRVHFRGPMNPLELEMFHQINNIIGVDPELYEYLFMVDADTSVREDSLNRLVAACAGDANIAACCGETGLQNEERSWWTMIQVYEYYISHHLSKAFESLFGSVTCLPGCFSMYRLRTADRGKPLIISDDVIREYSDCNIDTLHKKNLLSLGEDRFLTTLMTKHFPYMSYKFIPDAYCQTASPETWSVLLSQRRRWINSTIHNLVELASLREMCGFCCFSMRFVVIIDLTGTLMLPATCVYLGYLIYNAATHSGQFPIISIVVLAAVYGLQALIFIIKRQWQHIGWMLIYLMAFPIYSFVLPIYSFWNQDNFTWGNTRVVIGETGKRTLVAVEDDGGFDPRAIPLQRWDDYALANKLPGRRGGPSSQEKNDKATTHKHFGQDAYEMDDMKSVYSSAMQPSVMTRGLTPAPYTDNPRQSMLSVATAQKRASSALSFDYQHGQQGPDDVSVTDAIRAVLRDVDLDTVTKKQVRALVEQKLGTVLVGERRTFMDRQIDTELANM